MTHYGPEPLPDRDPTPPDAYEDDDPADSELYCQEQYPPHDPDAEPCFCLDCCEREWTRQQEAQAESPSEWNQAYRTPIDKREMRRRE